jgi:hypothetical protein
LDKLTEKAAQKATEEGRKLNEKVAGLRSQIERLLDEKREIQGLPMTVKETLETAKKILAEKKQKLFIEELLVKELSSLQNQHGFLETAGLRVHLLSDLNLFRWVFGSWINEVDLVEAVKFLPGDVGISEIQKKEKTDVINRKVTDLEKQIEKLLG